MYSVSQIERVHILPKNLIGIENDYNTAYNKKFEAVFSEKNRFQVEIHDSCVLVGFFDVVLMFKGPTFCLDDLIRKFQRYR